MEADFNLYKHILSVVDKQIQDNYPPEVKVVYDKLQENGNDADEAREAIASVIAEEMYFLLLDEDKSFNEERYVKKLQQLL